MSRWFKYAFSLVELMVTLIVVSIITAAMAPVITKKLKSKEVTVSSSANKNIEFEQDCSAFGEDCAICFDDRCALCAKVCNDDEYVDTPECVCKSCSIYEQCLECSAKQCTKCNLGYYLQNRKCAICPIANQCDGVYKTPCADGYYNDVEGLGICKTCASKVENCLICNKETGACETCADGYELKEEICKSKELKYTYSGNSIKEEGVGYDRITLKSSGTFTAETSATGQILVLGGGGGGAGSYNYWQELGGCRHGGNGCTGYNKIVDFEFVAGSSWWVSVGGGGGGGSGHCYTPADSGGNGGASSFDSISASGGGGGHDPINGVCSGGQQVTFAGITYVAENTYGRGGSGGTLCTTTDWGSTIGFNTSPGTSGYSGVVVIKIPK